MRQKSAKTVLGLGCLVLLFASGCATSRGIVRLDQPLAASPATASGKTVFIGEVTDNRVFEQNPKTQDIPSLGFEGSAAASADLKLRAIARKRNTYGKALGDILLEPGQTVESVMRDALRRALVEGGYTVVDQKPAAGSDTPVVDASIDKFWGYMTPGFWAITLSCDIATTLRIRPPLPNTQERETVAVKAEGHFQIPGGSAWMEVFRKALDQYVEQVKQKLAPEPTATPPRS